MFIYSIRAVLYKYRYAICFCLLFTIYFFNLFIDVMDIDAAQYASISREMFESGSFLQVFERGNDYLDKPPLLFWLAAMSFKIFGVSTFAYKLLPVLVILLGIYSTFRFAKLYYRYEIAILSALVLASTQAFFLMTNDVRTDGILTGFVMFSIWQLSEYIIKNKFSHLFLAALGGSLAMMAKGPIGLVIVASAIGGDLLLKRKWNIILHYKWFLFVCLILVFLLPMCYGLYQQFDLHPEKEVYGLNGPSGIKFFFWTQSFGRITGDIYWDNGAGFFYFFTTILWDFQPWILIFIVAIIFSISQFIKSRFKIVSSYEYISWIGFAFNFFALSTSHYKLPHYIFSLFPFAAIITSNFIYSLEVKSKMLTFLINIQFILTHLFYLAVFFLFLFVFNINTITILIIVIAGLFFTYYSFFRLKNKVDRIIFPSIITAIMVGFVLSSYFYPQLLAFQSASVVGKEISEMNVPNNQFYSYHTQKHSLDFYSKRIVPIAHISDIGNYKEGTFIYTDKDGVEEIMVQKKMNYTIVKEFDDFSVTRLNTNFLRENKRKSQLKKTYLLKKVAVINELKTQ